MIVNKQYYADSEGAWKETMVAELKKLLALIIYFGLVNVNSFHDYWSTKSVYHGLWARSIMSCDRFKGLMSMLHVVDPAAEDETDKLRKVRSFIEHIRNQCKELYQNVAIDERLVKSKHRSGMRQHMPAKPVKFGLKLWVLADALNAYTYDFDIYTGKGKEHIGENGLGYSVVMNLGTPLLHHGYHFYLR